MCLLIAFHRVWDDAPLVIAVNRDEAYDRPAAPPEWVDADPPILMPRDGRAGGTWMGANGSGVWVGLTNRHGPDVDPALRSRGLLCLELLGAPDGRAVAQRVAALEESYNPFNLVAGDSTGLHLSEYSAGRARTRWLGPGCHIVTNRPFDEAPGEPKVIRSRARLAQAGLWPRERLGGRLPEDLVGALAGILANHGGEGQDALCLHGERYGTRSAAVWRIAPPTASGGSAEVALFYADGPPCSAPFGRVTGPSA